MAEGHVHNLETVEVRSSTRPAPVALVATAAGGAPVVIAGPARQSLARVTFVAAVALLSSVLAASVVTGFSIARRDARAAAGAANACSTFESQLGALPADSSVSGTAAPFRVAQAAMWKAADRNTAVQSLASTLDVAVAELDRSPSDAAARQAATRLAVRVATACAGL